MATSKDFINFVETHLAHIPGIRTRAMFGEYALYCNGMVVGFVCDNTLFMKITPGTSKLLEPDIEKGPAYPGSKDYYIVPEHMLEDTGLMAKLLVACSEDVLAQKHTKKKS